MWANFAAIERSGWGNGMEQPAAQFGVPYSASSDQPTQARWFRGNLFWPLRRWPKTIVAIPIAPALQAVLLATSRRVIDCSVTVASRQTKTWSWTLQLLSGRANLACNVAHDLRNTQLECSICIHGHTLAS